jgi:hypothetical protein
MRASPIFCFIFLIVCVSGHAFWYCTEDEFSRRVSYSFRRKGSAFWASARDSPAWRYSAGLRRCSAGLYLLQPLLLLRRAIPCSYRMCRPLFDTSNPFWSEGGREEDEDKEEELYSRSKTRKRLQEKE